MADGLSSAIAATLVEELRPVGRATRRPQHQFQVEHRPWEIQPFFIAPVIPGETMDNMLMQVRAVSDPIKHPLIGWWLNHYVFYVKLTDLDDGDLFKELMLSSTATITAGTHYDNVGTAVPEFFKGATKGYDFVKACLKRVTETFFRDEDETWDAKMQGPLPVAHYLNPDKNSVLDSLSKDAVEPVLDPVGGGPAEPVWDSYQEQFLKMRELRMIPQEFTYEAWLKSFGIHGEEVKKPQWPELLRKSSDWTYPSNTVDAATGVPSSAASWTIAERADKKRFFKEPGFIFGVTVARPKVYLGKQHSTVSLFLDNAFAWMPALLRDSPETSLRKFLDDGPGPLKGNTGALDYWIDLRDLHVHGEQFTNFDPATAGKGGIALPGATLTKATMRYPALADMEALFTSAATSGVKAGRTIRQDGVVALSIKTKEVDFT